METKRIAGCCSARVIFNLGDAINGGADVHNGVDDAPTAKELARLVNDYSRDGYSTFIAITSHDQVEARKALRKVGFRSTASVSGKHCDSTIMMHYLMLDHKWGGIEVPRWKMRSYQALVLNKETGKYSKEWVSKA